MLPPKPLSEMTDEEILKEIREIRAKRVAARERASKPRVAKRAQNDAAITSLIEQALALSEENET